MGSHDNYFKQETEDLIDEKKDNCRFEESIPKVSHVDNRPKICQKIYPTGYWQEFKSTLWLAWPIVFTQITNMGMQTVAVMMGGHLGKIELDALTLGNTLINIMGSSVAFGASTACDTAFSQTYGSGNKKMVGVYLQRSIIILLLILCVTLALALNVEGILLLIGQDQEVSELVGLYMTVFIPGFLSNFMYIVLRKYLQCQDVVYPHIIIGAGGLGLHALLQYLLLYQAKLGILGSSLAQGCGYIFMLTGTVVYTLCSGIYKDTWGGWSWRCFEDWGKFFRLAVFGILMTCLEWWAFEIITVLAGILGTVELAAFGVVLNLDILFYSIPSGFGIASCIRVGQLLGAGQPKHALNASNVGMSIVAITSLIAASLFAILRWELPKLFTEDADVIELAANLLPMCAIYTFFDNIGAIARGVFQGAGRQAVGTIVVLVTYYCLAMPVGIPLMFLTPLGMQGIWGALTGSVIVTSIVFLVLLVFVFDWQKMSEQAKIRAGVHRNKKFQSEEKPEKKISSYDEKTPLLHNSLKTEKHLPNGLSGSFVSFSSPDKPAETPLTKSLVLRRVATILIFIGILVTGIILRVTVPISDLQESTPNATMTNSTQQMFSTIHLAFVPLRIR